MERLAGRSGDGDPAPPDAVLSAEDRAAIQRFAGGNTDGKSWFGPMANRCFIGYEATVVALESALASQRAARARVEEERDALREVDAAQTILLACYRRGNRHGADAALTRLEKARATLAGRPEAVSRDA